MNSVANDEESIGRFLEMSVGELKFYLQQRGQPISGSHGLLVTRALNSTRTELRCSCDSRKVSKFSQIDIGNISAYILASLKAFTTEYIGQYKVTMAFSYFMSGFVDMIFTLPL